MPHAPGPVPPSVEIADGTGDHQRLVVHFHDDEGRPRERRAGARVLEGHVALPPLPPRLQADVARQIAFDLQLAPGEVEPLSLPRARLRWPGLRDAVAAASAAALGLGLPDLRETGELALMACRGARFHHDGDAYGDKAFCNLFLGEDLGLDVLFPLPGRRIPLARGTLLAFDTAQPHAVVPRAADRFDPADFDSRTHGVPPRDSVFLSWELPITDPAVARALGVVFAASESTSAGREGVWLNGEPLRLCPLSGRVLPEADQART